MFFPNKHILLEKYLAFCSQSTAPRYSEINCSSNWCGEATGGIAQCELAFHQGGKIRAGSKTAGKVWPSREERAVCWYSHLRIRLLLAYHGTSFLLQLLGGFPALNSLQVGPSGKISEFSWGSLSRRHSRWVTPNESFPHQVRSRKRLQMSTSR